MEGKGMESANTLRAPATSAAAVSSTSSANASGNETAWWRWTHGKSGSISSSSDGAAMAYSYSPTAATSHTLPSDAAASLPAWESAPRWQKRTTRTGLQSREDTAGSVGSPSLSFSSSPKFAASASSSFMPSSNNGSSRITASSLAKKKMVQTSIRTARDVAIKKRFSSSTAIASQDFSLATPTKESRTLTAAASHDRSSLSEIKWMLGPGKRKVVKKDKKLSRVTSLQQSRPSFNSSSHGPMRAWLDDGHLSDEEAFHGLHVDVEMLEEKSARCFSPTSTASTISSSASEASSETLSAQTRFVKSCALAIIEDCHREQHGGQYTRKRKLEGRAKVDDSCETVAWAHVGLSKSPGGCGSSSSDEELCHASTKVSAHCGDGKSGRDFEGNLAPEEIHRQTLLGHRSLGSSSSFDSSDMLRLSPPSKAQGLPLDIQRRLPVKIGTAAEIDKECPICQSLYGIGDQILRLPCEHFFHASCVDEWMRHHTSCPLCRTNVLDADVEDFILKHKLTEKETVKRAFLPSSQSIRFRPLEPEVDRLESHLAGMVIGDESADKCLVCPTPTRPQRK